MKIVSNRYGKKRVRVLKVLRTGSHHEVKELDVSCLLHGAFDSSYDAASNASVVPTDTVKNTITVLAHKRLGLEAERFAIELGNHFLSKYAHVHLVEIECREKKWNRHGIEGRGHEHAFVASAATPLTRVLIARDRLPEVTAGIDDLLILKSTGSAFAGFPRCDLTTLPETNDRILSTQLRALWHFTALPANFNVTNASILDAMLTVFAQEFSVSVQATMHDMAQAAFARCSEINRIELALPNKHYLLANLKPFQLENENVTFIPTDDPHGQIEAVFARE